MVFPEPPLRTRAQPQPSWGVRRRRSAQHGRPPGPMQRLPRPERRGWRARGAACALVPAWIPARTPVALPACCSRLSVPAPSPRPGLPRRTRWIIRLSGPGGDSNSGGGKRRGGARRGSLRPASAQAPSRLSPGGGLAEAPPPVPAARHAPPPAGPCAPRRCPARSRLAALPAHPSLTPCTGRGGEEEESYMNYFYFIPKTVLIGMYYYYSHFMDKKTEAPQGGVTAQNSHCQKNG